MGTGSLAPMEPIERRPPRAARRRGDRAALSVAWLLLLLPLAGCDPAYQVWVVNERAQPVIVVFEEVSQDGVIVEVPTVGYTIPAGREGCTQCGIGSFDPTRLVAYDPDDCAVIGFADLAGSSAFVVTIPAEGELGVERRLLGDGEAQRVSEPQPHQVPCGSNEVTR